MEAQTGAFIEHCNRRRYHESLGNLTRADIYFGRGSKIRERRKRIKQQIIRNRRLQHHANAA
ncbi:MAG: transposase [Rhizobiaceae bacterium]|nr:transposase [Rhizobiaceae bacterium]